MGMWGHRGPPDPQIIKTMDPWIWRGICICKYSKYYKDALSSCGFSSKETGA